MADDTKRLAIDIEADASQAQQELTDTADQVAALERQSPEVAVTADTSKAQGHLDDVAGDVKALDGSTAKVQVTVDEKAISTARGKVGKLGDAGKEAGHAAGLNFGESFIRDSAGVFAQGGEGMFADVAAAAEAVGGVLPEEVMGPLMGALSVGGVAFLAVKKYWDMWSDRANKAKKLAQGVVEALAAGDMTQAAKEVEKSYGSLIKAGGKLGLSTKDVVGFIMGQSDALHVTDQAMVDNAGTYKLTLGALEKARKGYQQANGTLAEQQTRLFDVTRAMGGTNDAYLAQAKTAVPAVREAILNYVGALNGIPPQVMTSILTDADPNDVKQVEDQLNNAARDRTSTISAQIQLKGIPINPGGWVWNGSGYVPPNSYRPSAAAAGPMPAGPAWGAGGNVTVNLPFGADGRDVVAALNRHQRRAGGGFRVLRVAR